MEMEKKILSFVLDALTGQDLSPLIARLEIALAICNGLDPWNAKKALNVMFGGAADAE